MGAARPGPEFRSDRPTRQSIAGSALGLIGGTVPDGCAASLRVGGLMDPNRRVADCRGGHHVGSDGSMTTVVARAPGRVNLIGDHTDYTGGLCLPMAIDRSVVVRGVRDAAFADVRIESTTAAPVAPLPLVIENPAAIEPEWARYVAGVIAQLHPSVGFRGKVTSTIPARAGLSSSAALEIAAALALGATADTDPERLLLARLCQAAEHAARGVPTGLLDQLASIFGVAGHGLLIDCRALTVAPVTLPPAGEVAWLVIHTGGRTLANTGYSQRVEVLAAVEAEIGPVRDATASQVEALSDPLLRGRARHVVSENARVGAFAAAISAGDVAAAGQLMTASHRSLSVDFDSSTATIDALCQHLDGLDGVLGARITGAGWGGCVVAMIRPGAVSPDDFPNAWFVRPSDGAKVMGSESRGR